MTQFLASPAGARALIVLSIVYGGVVAVLSIYAPSALGPFSLIGALLLGLLWTLRAMLRRGGESGPTRRRDR